MAQPVRNLIGLQIPSANLVPTPGSDLDARPEPGLTTSRATVTPKSLRWLLLGIFPAGYAVCNVAIGPLPRSFALLTLADLAACATLLVRLGGPLRRTLWAWAGLVVLLDGLFLNMYLFASKLNSPQFLATYYPELQWVTRQQILRGYPWVTLGFATFCLSTSVVLAWQPSPARWRAAVGPRRVSTNYARQVVIAVFVVYLLASLLEARLGYGVLGEATPSLPLHLGTALTFVRANLAISLFVLSIWVLDSARSKWTPVAILLAVLSALIDGFISTSRGSLITLLLPILFLLMLTRRFTKVRKIGVLCILVAALALIPVFGALRSARLGSQGPATTASKPLTTTLTEGGTFLIIRVTGIDGVWEALGNEGRFSPGRTISFLKPSRLTDYYTHDIVRVKTANDFRAPGTVGGLMVVGGAMAVVLFVILFTLLMQLLWSLLLLLRTAPVALALAALAVATFFQGGAFDFFLLVKVLIEVGICEMLYRKVLQRANSGVPVV